MKTFLVTAAVIFSMPAFADNMKYEYSCGYSVGTNLVRAVGNAGDELMNTIEKLKTSLNSKYDIQSVAVTSAIYKQINWLSSEATLCATVAYKEKNVNAPAEDLHYAFPCAIGFEASQSRGLVTAGKVLSGVTDAYLKKVSAENFEAVNVAGTLATFNAAENAAVMCSTVTLKAKSGSSKEVSLLPGTGVR